jgi:hypothetical protein
MAFDYKAGDVYEIRNGSKITIINVYLGPMTRLLEFLIDNNSVSTNYAAYYDRNGRRLYSSLEIESPWDIIRKVEPASVVTRSCTCGAKHIKDARHSAWCDGEHPIAGPEMGA